MRRCRRFAGAALEIDHRQNLHLLPCPSMGNVAFHVRPTVLVQKLAERHHLFSGVSPSSGHCRFRLGTLALQVQLLDMARGDTQELGNLGQRERAQPFGRVRRKLLKTQYIQLVGNPLALFKDGCVEIELNGVSRNRVHLGGPQITFFRRKSRLKCE